MKEFKITCPKCFNSLNENERICPHCGNNISEETYNKQKSIWEKSTKYIEEHQELIDRLAK